MFNSRARDTFPDDFDPYPVWTTTRLSLGSVWLEGR